MPARCRSWLQIQAMGADGVDAAVGEQFDRFSGGCDVEPWRREVIAESVIGQAQTWLV
jgi:hypothetical protein